MKKNILHRSLLNSSNEILTNYLTMTALEDGFQASLFKELEYCVDGDGDWKTISGEQFTESINTGQTISFRGNLSPANDGSGIGTFSASKKFNLSGDCMSLLYGDDAKSNDSVPDYAFKRLFYTNSGITAITSDNLLHATVLGRYCYYEMFDSSNITSVPLNLLPATTLAQHCYGYMFSYTRLTDFPQLPAQNLAYGCYYRMFASCNLITAPELPATTLADYCYNGMFMYCRKLVTAPELFATILTSGCYNQMFYNCTNLNYIKMLATDLPIAASLSQWVTGVSSTGTFVKHPSMTTLPTGESGIPSGWTVIDDEE